MAIANAAPEFGAKFVLTGPDGTRAVFNDSTDVDYVGMLNEETSGLDSAEVREDAAELVQGDGGIHGDFFSGRRPIVLGGDIDGTATTAAVRNERIARLQKAALAFRGDASLTWTPQGGTARELTTLRRNQPLRISGAYHKKFSLPLVAADPRIYGPLTTLTKAYTAPTTETNSAKLPGAATTTGTGQAWTSPNNVKVSDNAYATSQLVASTLSAWLSTSTYGFAIPAGALILGIKVSTERSASLTGGEIYVTQLSLTKVAGVALDESAIPGGGGIWTTTDATEDFGGSKSLWGSPWSVADINSSGFGAMIRCSNKPGKATVEAKVDAVTITVYYMANGEVHSETITNNGNTTSYPNVKVIGKTLATGLALTNSTTAEEFFLNNSAETGHTFIVDFAKKTVTLDSADYSRYVRFPAGWWGLQPGANVLALPPSAEVVVKYRDAWL